MILNENVDRKILPIAGGKGGVGKSVVSVNLALSLALYNKKTILVDLDLGGSNIHTLLGQKNTLPGIGNYISGLNSSITELVYPTYWENLHYIPGDVLVHGIGELTKASKTRIVKGILELDADYIIIDLGGGTNFTVVDFFLISNSGLIVTTSQPTSIINAYSFLKNYTIRFFQRAFVKNKEVSSLLKRVIKERDPNERKTIADIIQLITEKDPDAGEKAKCFLDVLQPKIILNKVDDPSDLVLAEGLRDICKKNLAINLECLGTIMHSDIVDKSVNTLSPFVSEFPDEIVTSEIHRIAQKIIQSKKFPDMPLQLDYYSDSFELAHIEVENDIAAKKQKNPATPIDSEYDTDKLLELIRYQQKQIQDLQGTLRMLSMENSNIL